MWLKIAKKASGIPTVTHAEALEEALCYGWIDGQRAPHDDTYFLQRFTPRRPRSKWSQINRDKADQLIEEADEAGRARAGRGGQGGRTMGGGLRAPEPATVPDDFQRALDENPAAKEFFEP